MLPSNFRATPRLWWVDTDREEIAFTGGFFSFPSFCISFWLFPYLCLFARFFYTRCRMNQLSCSFSVLNLLRGIFFQLGLFSHTTNQSTQVFRHWPEAPSTMQAVAAEFNLAETAFVQRRGVRDGWDLRWFTPTVEVWMKIGSAVMML